MGRKALALTVLALTLLGAGCTTSVNSELTGTSSDAYSTDTSASVTTPVVKGETSTKPMTYTYQGVLPAEKIENKQVKIETNMGDITIAFYPDTAPIAVSNFISLAEKGYYDNVIFHRVIEGFMIQGGDPTGTGRGGPGYQFEDELNDDHEYMYGTVAMANAGPNTNGSQFFIMHKDYPLPHDYTIFGWVTDGMQVVDAIAKVPKDRNDKPLQDVVMKKVTVMDMK
jgi:cyclophilin family peptidyl-prolyl cis-trans isomerase